MIRHVVKGGETLTNIAKQYGSDLNTVLQLNKDITDPNVIKVGQEVVVPATQYDDAIKEGIRKLQTGVDWGPVWNEVKARFPNVADEQIDKDLGKEWREEGAYERYLAKKQKVEVVEPEFPEAKVEVVEPEIPEPKVEIVPPPEAVEVEVVEPEVPEPRVDIIPEAEVPPELRPRAPEKRPEPVPEPDEARSFFSIFGVDVTEQMDKLGERFDEFFQPKAPEDAKKFEGLKQKIREGMTDYFIPVTNTYFPSIGIRTNAPEATVQDKIRKGFGNAVKTMLDAEEEVRIDDAVKNFLNKPVTDKKIEELKDRIDEAIKQGKGYEEVLDIYNQYDFTLVSQKGEVQRIRKTTAPKAFEIEQQKAESTRQAEFDWLRGPALEEAKKLGIAIPIDEKGRPLYDMEKMGEEALKEMERKAEMFALPEDSPLYQVQDRTTRKFNDIADLLQLSRDATDKMYKLDLTTVPEEKHRVIEETISEMGDIAESLSDISATSEEVKILTSEFDDVSKSADEMMDEMLDQKAELDSLIDPEMDKYIEDSYRFDAMTEFEQMTHTTYGMLNRDRIIKINDLAQKFHSTLDKYNLEVTKGNKIAERINVKETILNNIGPRLEDLVNNPTFQDAVIAGKIMNAGELSNAQKIAASYRENESWIRNNYSRVQTDNQKLTDLQEQYDNELKSYNEELDRFYNKLLDSFKKIDEANEMEARARQFQEIEELNNESKQHAAFEKARLVKPTSIIEAYREAPSRARLTYDLLGSRAWALFDAVIISPYIKAPLYTADGITWGPRKLWGKVTGKEVKWKPSQVVFEGLMKYNNLLFKEAWPATLATVNEFENFLQWIGMETDNFLNKKMKSLGMPNEFKLGQVIMEPDDAGPIDKALMSIRMVRRWLNYPDHTVDQEQLWSRLDDRKIVTEFEGPLESFMDPWDLDAVVGFVEPTPEERIEAVKKLNPHIKDFDKIPIGTEILLYKGAKDVPQIMKNWEKTYNWMRDARNEFKYRFEKEGSLMDIVPAGPDRMKIIADIQMRNDLYAMGIKDITKIPAGTEIKIPITREDDISFLNILNDQTRVKLQNNYPVFTELLDEALMIVTDPIDLLWYPVGRGTRRLMRPLGQKIAYKLLDDAERTGFKRAALGTFEFIWSLDNVIRKGKVPTERFYSPQDATTFRELLTTFEPNKINLNTLTVASMKWRGISLAKLLPYKGKKITQLTDQELGVLRAQNEVKFIEAVAKVSGEFDLPATRVKNYLREYVADPIRASADAEDVFWKFNETMGLATEDIRRLMQMFPETYYKRVLVKKDKTKLKDLVSDEIKADTDLFNEVVELNRGLYGEAFDPNNISRGVGVIVSPDNFLKEFRQRIFESRNLGRFELVYYGEQVANLDKVGRQALLDLFRVIEKVDKDGKVIKRERMIKTTEELDRVKKKLYEDYPKKYHGSIDRAVEAADIYRKRDDFFRRMVEADQAVPIKVTDDFVFYGITPDDFSALHPHDQALWKNNQNLILRDPDTGVYRVMYRRTRKTRMGLSGDLLGAFTAIAQQQIENSRRFTIGKISDNWKTLFFEKNQKFQFDPKTRKLTATSKGKTKTIIEYVEAAKNRGEMGPVVVYNLLRTAYLNPKVGWYHQFLNSAQRGELTSILGKFDVVKNKKQVVWTKQMSELYPIQDVVQRTYEGGIKDPKTGVREMWKRTGVHEIGEGRYTPYDPEVDLVFSSAIGLENLYYTNPNLYAKLRNVLDRSYQVTKMWDREKKIWIDRPDAPFKLTPADELVYFLMKLGGDKPAFFPKAPYNIVEMIMRGRYLTDQNINELLRNFNTLGTMWAVTRRDDILKARTDAALYETTKKEFALYTKFELNKTKDANQFTTLKDKLKEWPGMVPEKEGGNKGWSFEKYTDEQVRKMSELWNDYEFWFAERKLNKQVSYILRRKVPKEAFTEKFNKFTKEIQKGGLDILMKMDKEPGATTRSIPKIMQDVFENNQRSRVWKVLEPRLVDRAVIDKLNEMEQRAAQAKIDMLVTQEKLNIAKKKKRSKATIDKWQKAYEAKRVEWKKLQDVGKDYAKKMAVPELKFVDRVTPDRRISKQKHVSEDYFVTPELARELEIILHPTDAKGKPNPWYGKKFAWFGDSAEERAIINYMREHPSFVEDTHFEVLAPQAKIEETLTSAEIMQRLRAKGTYDPIVYAILEDRLPAGSGFRANDSIHLISQSVDPVKAAENPEYYLRNFEKALATPIVGIRDETGSIVKTKTAMELLLEFTELSDIEQRMLVGLSEEGIAREATRLRRERSGGKRVTRDYRNKVDREEAFEKLTPEEVGALLRDIKSPREILSYEKYLDKLREWNAAFYAAKKELGAIDIVRFVRDPEARRPKTINVDPAPPEVLLLPPPKTKLEKQAYGKKMSRYAIDSASYQVASRFGVKVKVINRREMKWAGQFVNGQVYINRAYAKASTPFHEIAHPFIEVISRENVDLYKALKKELDTEGEILKYIEKKYPEIKVGSEDFYKEGIAEAIGRYAADKISLTTGQRLISKVRELLDRVADYFNVMFGKREVIRPGELRPDLTLEDIGNLIALEKRKVDIGDAAKYSAVDDAIERELGTNLTAEQRADMYVDRMYVLPQGPYNPRTRTVDNLDRALTDGSFSGFKVKRKLLNQKDADMKAISKRVNPVELKYKFVDWLGEKKPDTAIALTSPFKFEGIKKAELEAMELFRKDLLETTKEKSMPASELADAYRNWLRQRYDLGVVDVTGHEMYGIKNLIPIGPMTDIQKKKVPIEYKRRLFVDDAVITNAHRFGIREAKKRYNGIGWYAEFKIGDDVFIHEFQSDILPEIKKSFVNGDYEIAGGITGIEEVAKREAKNRVSMLAKYKNDLELMSAMDNYNDVAKASEKAVHEIDLNIKANRDITFDVTSNKIENKLIRMYFDGNTQQRKDIAKFAEDYKAEFARLESEAEKIPAKELAAKQGQIFIEQNTSLYRRNEAGKNIIKWLEKHKLTSDLIAGAKDKGIFSRIDSVYKYEPEARGDLNATILGIAELNSKLDAGKLKTMPRLGELSKLRKKQFGPHDPMADYVLAFVEEQSKRLGTDTTTGKLLYDLDRKYYKNIVDLNANFKAGRTLKVKIGRLEFKRGLYKNLDSAKKIIDYYQGQEKRYRTTFMDILSNKAVKGRKIADYDVYKRYADLYDSWFDITIRHALYNKKAEGYRSVYLPTGKASDLIEGNSLASKLYYTVEESAELNYKHFGREIWDMMRGHKINIGEFGKQFLEKQVPPAERALYKAYAAWQDAHGGIDELRKFGMLADVVDSTATIFSGILSGEIKSSLPEGKAFSKLLQREHSNWVNGRGDYVGPRKKTVDLRTGKETMETKPDIANPGVFYTKLKKIKGAKVSFETPRWSRTPLIRVDLDDMTDGPIPRFQKMIDDVGENPSAMERIKKKKIVKKGDEYRKRQLAISREKFDDWEWKVTRRPSEDAKAAAEVSKLNQVGGNVIGKHLLSKSAREAFKPKKLPKAIRDFSAEELVKNLGVAFDVANKIGPDDLARWVNDKSDKADYRKQIKGLNDQLEDLSNQTRKIERDYEKRINGEYKVIEDGQALYNRQREKAKKMIDKEKDPKARAGMRKIVAESAIEFTVKRKQIRDGIDILKKERDAKIKKLDKKVDEVSTDLAAVENRMRHDMSVERFLLTGDTPDGKIVDKDGNINTTIARHVYDELDREIKRVQDSMKRQEKTLRTGDPDIDYNDILFNYRTNQEALVRLKAIKKSVIPMAVARHNHIPIPIDGVYWADKGHITPEMGAAMGALHNAIADMGDKLLTREGLKEIGVPTVTHPTTEVPRITAADIKKQFYDKLPSAKDLGQIKIMKADIVQVGNARSMTEVHAAIKGLFRKTGREKDFPVVFDMSGTLKETLDSFRKDLERRSTRMVGAQKEELIRQANEVRGYIKNMTVIVDPDFHPDNLGRILVGEGFGMNDVEARAVTKMVDKMKERGAIWIFGESSELASPWHLKNSMYGKGMLPEDRAMHNLMREDFDQIVRAAADPKPGFPGHFPVDPDSFASEFFGVDKKGNITIDSLLESRPQIAERSARDMALAGLEADMIRHNVGVGEAADYKKFVRGSNILVVGGRSTFLNPDQRKAIMYGYNNGTRFVFNGVKMMPGEKAVFEFVSSLPNSKVAFMSFNEKNIMAIRNGNPVKISMRDPKLKKTVTKAKHVDLMFPTTRQFRTKAMRDLYEKFSLPGTVNILKHEELIKAKLRQELQESVSKWMGDPNKFPPWFITDKMNMYHNSYFQKPIKDIMVDWASIKGRQELKEKFDKGIDSAMKEYRDEIRKGFMEQNNGKPLLDWQERLIDEHHRQAIEISKNIKRYVFKFDMPSRLIESFKRKMANHMFYLHERQRQEFDDTFNGIHEQLVGEVPRNLRYYERANKLFLKTLPDVNQVQKTIRRTAFSTFIWSVLMLRPGWLLWNYLGDSMRVIMGTRNVRLFIDISRLQAEATALRMKKHLINVREFTKLMIGKEADIGVYNLEAYLKAKKDSRSIPGMLRSKRVRKAYMESIKPRNKNLVNEAIELGDWESITSAGLVQYLADPKKAEGHVRVLRDYMDSEPLNNFVVARKTARKLKLAGRVFFADYVSMAAQLENMRRVIMAHDLMYRKAFNKAKTEIKVKKFLYDYRDLTLAGRFFRTFFPFYAFTAKSIGLYLGAMIKYGPGVYQASNALLDAYDKLSADMPDQFKERVPFGDKIWVLPHFGVLEYLRVIVDPFESLKKFADNPLKMSFALGWGPFFAGGIELVGKRGFHETGPLMRDFGKYGWFAEEQRRYKERDASRFTDELTYSDEPSALVTFMMAYLPPLRVMESIFETDYAVQLRGTAWYNSKKVRAIFKWFGLNYLELEDVAFVWDSLNKLPPHERDLFKRSLEAENPDLWKYFQQYNMLLQMDRINKAKGKSKEQKIYDLHKFIVIQVYFEKEWEKDGSGDVWLAQNPDIKHIVEKHFDDLEKQYGITSKQILGKRKFEMAQVEASIRKMLTTTRDVDQNKIARMNLAGISHPFKKPFKEAELRAELFDKFGNLKVKNIDEVVKILEKYDAIVTFLDPQIYKEEAEVDYQRWQALGLEAQEQARDEDARFYGRMSLVFATLPDNLDELPDEEANKYWDKYNKRLEDLILSIPKWKQRYLDEMPPWQREYYEKRVQYGNWWGEMIQRIEREEDTDFFNWFNAKPGWFRKWYYLSNPDARLYFPLVQETNIRRQKIVDTQDKTGFDPADWKGLYDYIWKNQNALKAWDRRRPGTYNYYDKLKQLYDGLTKAREVDDSTIYFDLFFQKKGNKGWDDFREFYFSKEHNTWKRITYPYVRTWLELQKRDEENELLTGKRTNLATVWFWSEKNKKARETYHENKKIDGVHSVVDYQRVWKDAADKFEKDPGIIYQFVYDQEEWFRNRYFDIHPDRKVYYPMALKMQEFEEFQDRLGYFFKAENKTQRDAWERDKPGIVGYYKFWYDHNNIKEKDGRAAALEFYFSDANKDYRLRHDSANPGAIEAYTLWKQYEAIDRESWEGRKERREFLRENPKLREWWDRDKDISEEEVAFNLQREIYYTIIDKVEADGKGRQYYLDYFEARAKAQKYFDDNPEFEQWFKSDREITRTPKQQAMDTLMEQYNALDYDSERREFLLEHEDLDRYLLLQVPPGIRRIRLLQRAYFKIEHEDSDKQYELRQTFLDRYPELEEYWEVSKMPTSYWTDRSKFDTTRNKFSKAEKFFEAVEQKQWRSAEKFKDLLPAVPDTRTEEGRWLLNKLYGRAMSTWATTFGTFMSTYYFKMLPSWLRNEYFKRHPEKKFLSYLSLGRQMEEGLRIEDNKRPDQAWAVRQQNKFRKNIPFDIKKQVEDILVKRGTWQDRSVWTDAQWDQWWEARIARVNALRQKDLEELPLLRSELLRVMRRYPLSTLPKPLKGWGDVNPFIVTNVIAFTNEEFSNTLEDRKVLTRVPERAKI
jgi:hypothetical protein